MTNLIKCGYFDKYDEHRSYHFNYNGMNTLNFKDLSELTLIVDNITNTSSNEYISLYNDAIRFDKEYNNIMFVLCPELSYLNNYRIKLPKINGIIYKLDTLLPWKSIDKPNLSAIIHIEFVDNILKDIHGYIDYDKLLKLFDNNLVNGIINRNNLVIKLDKYIESSSKKYKDSISSPIKIDVDQMKYYNTVSLIYLILGNTKNLLLVGINSNEVDYFQLSIVNSLFYNKIVSFI